MHFICAEDAALFACGLFRYEKDITMNIEGDQSRGNRVFDRTDIC